MEHEEVSLQGAPQGSTSMTEGDGYSKVVKRTVLKSEGDHTEVCGGIIVFLVKLYYSLNFCRKTKTFVLIADYK